MKKVHRIYCSDNVLLQCVIGACVWLTPPPALPQEQMLPAPLQFSLHPQVIPEFKKEISLPEPLLRIQPQIITMPVVAEEAELPKIEPALKPTEITMPVVAEEAELPKIEPELKPTEITMPVVAENTESPKIEPALKPKEAAIPAVINDDPLLEIAKSPNQSEQDIAAMELDLSSLVIPAIDNCAQQLKSSEMIKTCHDEYLDNKVGPALIVFSKVTSKSVSFAMTKYPITAQDYHTYCVLTRQCAAENTPAPNETKDDLPVGLDLSDIEQSVDDYNRYCAISGNCPGVIHEDNNDPITNITYEQAKAYSRWLSEQTHRVYRLPTRDEWDTLAMEEDYSSCQPLYYTNDNSNQFMENQLGLVLSPNVYQEWIFAVDTEGTVQLQTDEGCHVIFKPQYKKYRDTKTTFRLVREITSDIG